MRQYPLKFVGYSADKPSMKVMGAIILAVSWSLSLSAGERAQMVLRGIVPSSITTKISQTRLTPSKSVFTFSSHVNSRYSREAQKFEVEGLEQSGFDTQIRELSGNSRTIQYELLVNHLKNTMPDHRPIFLKISAN